MVGQNFILDFMFMCSVKILNSRNGILDFDKWDVNQEVQV